MDYRKLSSIAYIFVLSSFLLLNCSAKKEEDPVPEVSTPAIKSTTYSFNGDIGVSGTFTLTEVSATETKVDLSVNVSATESYPVEIYSSSAVESGTVLYVLNPLDNKGKSTKILSVPYSTLLNLDAHVKVFNSEAKTMVIALCDIGGNVLTGKEKTYKLSPEAGYSVGGSVTFKERKNGNVLAIINLVNVEPGKMYSASLRTGSATSVNSIEDAVLNDIDGSARKSQTNLKIPEIKYNNLLTEPRFVRITSADKTIVYAEGNIGNNSPN